MKRSMPSVTRQELVEAVENAKREERERILKALQDLPWADAAAVRELVLGAVKGES